MVVFKQWLSWLGFGQASQCAPVMVVGMHRSGTSFLTGSLQQAGLELGKHSAWNPHNLKGNRENQDIVAFHDRVLAERGFSWDCPPAAPIVWSKQERSRAQQLVADYDGSLHWGFKDPRGLLLVDGWRKLLPELRFIGIFRHPLAVSGSLAARGGMPTAQALNLWQSYNSKLLALHQLQPFPLLCFDEDEEVLHGKLDQLLPTLGLRPLCQERFFSPDLKHHQFDLESVPDEFAPLYQALRQGAL